MTKKTLVLGASTNESRYSYLATNMLLKHNHEVLLLGVKSGEIQGEEIKKSWPENEEIDTITLYVSEKNQEPYKEDILNSGARRVIFNPGTENQSFENELKANGILAERACTLVLLSTHQYDD